MLRQSLAQRDLFREEDGFSTVGVVIALLITLSLVFTAAQVYQVNSASAEIQEVADTAALAAENVVAEYYLVARVCDAVVLSLAVTGMLAVGVGVVAICIPYTAEVGGKLIEAGSKVLKARDGFARKASEGLSRLQRVLPYLAAANAARVTAANSGGRMGASYMGIALLAPLQGEDLSLDADGLAQGIADTVEEQKGQIEEAGRRAEEEAKKAQEAKERAFQADCGNNPGYCMYERAASLAGLSGSDNPLFQSVDAWSFSAALERAKRYYPQRLAQEAPQADTLEEHANSALRKRFYRYACERIASGYVHEDEDSFEADFPLLPKNTSEMKETSLYTEIAYPVTQSEGGEELLLHAWDGCPLAQEVLGYASLEQQAAGGYGRCSECRFAASSMGKVAAASSSIDNGFEYHYRIVAAAAEDYEKAKAAEAPEARTVKDLAGGIFDQLGEALRSTASKRIEVQPPGRYGAIALVATLDVTPASQSFASSFVNDGSSLGARAAISSATLVSDSPEQGRTVLSSILDGVKAESDSLFVGALDGLLDVWSSALFAYADGQAKVGEGLDALNEKLSFLSLSGLGVWGSQQFNGLMEELGLQPAELDAPKPVLVNSGHVLEADSGTAVSMRLLSIKRTAASVTGGTLFDAVIGAFEQNAIEGVQSFDGEITIAEIELLGEGGPAVPITLALPDAAREYSLGAIEVLAERLRGLAASLTGERQWR